MAFIQSFNSDNQGTNDKWFYSVSQPGIMIKLVRGMLEPCVVSVPERSLNVIKLWSIVSHAGMAQI